MNNECKCPNSKCERHGNCLECQAYHKEKGNLPFCKREPKADR